MGPKNDFFFFPLILTVQARPSEEYNLQMKLPFQIPIKILNHPLYTPQIQVTLLHKKHSKDEIKTQKSSLNFINKQAETPLWT